MSKFLIKTIIFIILLICTISLIYLILPINEDSYLFGFVDKDIQLSKISNEKIIFMGGSNLAFGLNSKEIQQNTDKSVVNMGTHAGVGLHFMIEVIKPFLSKNDIIFISPEYEQFAMDIFWGSQTLVNLVAINPNYYKILNSKQKITILKKIFEPVQSKFRYFIFSILNLSNVNNKKNKEQIYTRKAFNEFGDVISHLSAPIHTITTEGKLQVDEKNIKYSIDFLNEFYLYCRNHKVKLYFIYPCLMEKSYNENVNEINKIVNNVNEKIHIPIIGKPEDFIFNEDFFFDTPYHLNAEGRIIRTKILLKAIQKYL